jgi:hypothetical protein
MEEENVQVIDKPFWFYDRMRVGREWIHVDNNDGFSVSTLPRVIEIQKS